MSKTSTARVGSMVPPPICHCQESPATGLHQLPAGGDPSSAIVPPVPTDPSDSAAPPDPVLPPAEGFPPVYMFPPIAVPTFPPVPVRPPVPAAAPPVSPLFGRSRALSLSAAASAGWMALDAEWLQAAAPSSAVAKNVTNVGEGDCFRMPSRWPRYAQTWSRDRPRSGIHCLFPRGSCLPSGSLAKR